MLRWWMVGVMLVAGCDTERPFVHCHCAALPQERALFEGQFVYTLEAVDVVEGTYEPPVASVGPSDAVLTVEEHYVVAEVGAHRAMFRVHQHADGDVVDVPGCCGPLGFVRTEPQPPWAVRSHLVFYPPDVGDLVRVIDPTLSRVEGTLLVSLDDGLPLEVDDDQLGFVVRTRYYIEPAACDDPSCSSTLLVTHHFRRP